MSKPFTEYGRLLEKIQLQEFTGVEFFSRDEKLFVHFRNTIYTYGEFCKIAQRDIDAMKILTAVYKQAMQKDIELKTFIQTVFDAENSIYDVTIKNGGQIWFDPSEYSNH